jgi:DNA-binding NarL/FixJ family response regulator
MDGLTIREIAARLYLSQNTVKTHLQHIYRKLAVRNRLEMEHRLPLSRKR